MQGDSKVRSASYTLNMITEVFLLPDHKQVANKQKPKWLDLNGKRYIAGERSF